jgi:phosphoglycerol transferase MdoB-like AlkP superfamily enzyme
MKLYFRQIRNTLGKLFILVLLYSLGRAVFFLANKTTFSANSPFELAKIFIYGIRFDYYAVIMFNLPFLLVYLLPFSFVNKRQYRRIADTLFILLNAGLLLLNLGDSEYFKYTGKRSTADLFKFIFMSDDVAILLPQFIHDFWYVGVVWILFIVGGVFAYRYFFHKELVTPYDFTLRTRVVALCTFVLLSGALFLGARGTGLKPFRMITAAHYTQSRNIPLLINTPFSIFQTLKKHSIGSKTYFTNAELSRIYTPEHTYSPVRAQRKDNVVIIILESFSKEFIGALNNGKGYTPCFDRIIRDGLVFENMFANGKQSIEALPAILAGIPALMTDPYISSSYSGNSLAALPSILAARGYHTSFFHGGRNGTMGFDEFAHLAGIENYIGKNEYQGPPAFDGKWGIMDEELLQFYANRLSSFPEPFFSSVFTLSSHHPYTVPERYKQKFASAPNALLQSVSYADYSLGQFFQTISKMPWYSHTLFVFVADHAVMEQSEVYGTRAGMYRIPLVFYHPGINTLKGSSKRIVQQTDIFPSIIDFLGINQPITAFGTSVFDSIAPGFAVNYLSGIYQYFSDSYMLSFDGEKSTALYNIFNDPLLKDNLLKKNNVLSSNMEQHLKAVIQQFDTRMKNNMLTIRQSGQNISSAHMH